MSVSERTVRGWKNSGNRDVAKLGHHPERETKLQHVTDEHQSVEMLLVVSDNSAATATPAGLGQKTCCLVGANSLQIDAGLSREIDDGRKGNRWHGVFGDTWMNCAPRLGAAFVNCYVSLALEDLNSFDVVVQGARGLPLPLKLPPENSRRFSCSTGRMW